jgi:hypothetical protein
MPDWPTNTGNAGSNIQTHLQAQNSAMDKKQAERDSKYATKDEMKKEIEELKKQIALLKEAVKFEKVHERGDLDGSVHAQHHTLGLSANNAAQGSHTHDGKNSLKLNMVGTPLAGADFTNTNISPYWIRSVTTITENPGDSNRARLLSGISVTGSRNTDTWRSQIMTILVRLGVTNSTTS